MALFEVYVLRKGEGILGQDLAEGVLITQSRNEAAAKVAALSRKGKEAWYEQIQ